MDSGYVPVNGLEMYYEIHGQGEPLVLLHGAFQRLVPRLAKACPVWAHTSRVIGFELQAHGRTADIDRPLSMEAMADDVAAALPELGVEKADVFGYSMGGGVALHLALRHPELVRKLVLMSMTYKLEGVHPGLMDGLGEMTPEMMHGSQLAILPGTSHVSVVDRAELLVPMISTFLDAPMPAG